MKFQHPNLINGEWRKDAVLGSAANTHRFANDSMPNGNFSRQLEIIRANAFEVKYAELKAMMLVPAAQGLDPGAVDYTYRFYNEVGSAELAAPGQSRGPRVDVLGTETTAKFKTFLASYAYDVQEIRASALSGNNLPQRKANAARKALAIKLDNALLLGAAGPDDLKVTGFIGLFTATNVVTFTSAIAGTFSTKTPDEIVNDLIGMENAIIVASNEVESPDTLVLPLSLKAQMQSRMGDGSDVTILKHYLSNTDSIKTVVFSQKLNANSAWTGARIVMYKRDPEKLEGITSIEFAQGAPQYEGWNTITECEMRTAGTVVYYPMSICYFDGN